MFKGKLMFDFKNISYRERSIFDQILIFVQKIENSMVWEEQKILFFEFCRVNQKKGKNNSCTPAKFFDQYSTYIGTKREKKKYCSQEQCSSITVNLYTKIRVLVLAKCVSI